MDSNFREAFEFMIAWEVGGDKAGGYTNDPDDPGGETRWGISKRAHPELDIKNLTKADAQNIYYVEYWLPMGCQEMSLPKATAVFDCAVNCGPRRAKLWMQQSVNLEQFILLRVSHYVKLAVEKESNRKFFLGWMKRADAVAKRCLGMGLNEEVVTWWE